MAIEVDTGGIESLRAPGRRMVFQRNVPSKQPALERKGAEFVAPHRGQQNGVALSCLPRVAWQPPGPKADHTRCFEKKVVKPGLHRVFMATKAPRDDHGRFLPCGESCRDLLHRDRSHLQDLSDAASAAIKRGGVQRGHATFGPTAKQIKRAAQKRSPQQAMLTARLAQQQVVIPTLHEFGCNWHRHVDAFRALWLPGFLYSLALVLAVSQVCVSTVCG